MCNLLLNRLSQIADLMNKKASKLLPTCTFVYVTRMRSGRIRTACLLAVFCSAQRLGVCPTPLDVDPPGSRSQRSRPPGCRSPPDADRRMRTIGCVQNPPMHTPWMQTPFCMQTPLPRQSPGCRPLLGCRSPWSCDL